MIEDILNKTFNKIIENNHDAFNITEDNESEDNESYDNGIGELDLNCCLHNVSEKEKLLFFVNYRGKPTEHFAKSLRLLN